MKTLAELLGRFKKSFNKSIWVKEVVGETIKKVTGIYIDPKDIELKDSVLEIRSSPARKNEIKMKEPEILSAVSQETNLKISRIFYK